MQGVEEIKGASRVLRGNWGELGSWGVLEVWGGASEVHGEAVGGVCKDLV